MAKNAGSIGEIRKKFHETHELIFTSHHEAGHIIYGLLHYMNIGSVLVFEDKKTKRIYGLTYYDPPILSKIQDIDLFNDRLHAEICLSYAGFLAEKKLFRNTSGSDAFPMFLKYKSYHDTKEATNLFQKYGLVEPGPKRYKYKRKLFKEIDSELEAYWSDLILVAHALFKKKKLILPELKLLLTKKSKNKDHWKLIFKNYDLLYSNPDGLDEENQKMILSI